MPIVEAASLVPNLTDSGTSHKSWPLPGC